VLDGGLKRGSRGDKRRARGGELGQDAPTVMTTAAIGKILDSYLTDVEGQSGFWRGTRDEITVYVMSDDAHDRVRIMAPIGELKEAESPFLQVLLQANFDRALDAKYALRGAEVWSVAVHPLATLAPDDIASYIGQVVKLVQNTGTTYASSDLVFMAHGDDAPGDREERGGDPGAPPLREPESE
jgi:hypothetical protein